MCCRVWTVAEIRSRGSGLARSLTLGQSEQTARSNPLVLGHNLPSRPGVYIWISKATRVSPTNFLPSPRPPRRPVSSLPSTLPSPSDLPSRCPLRWLPPPPPPPPRLPPSRPPSLRQPSTSSTTSTTPSAPSRPHDSARDTRDGRPPPPLPPGARCPRPGLPRPQPLPRPRSWCRPGRARRVSIVASGGMGRVRGPTTRSIGPRWRFAGRIIRLLIMDSGRILAM